MSSPKSPPTVRPQLSREAVLEVAIALADRDGIHSVTMRKVARELGVEAMSLYHHVDGKGALLDGMVGLVVAEVDLPRDDGDGWRDVMRARSGSVRRVLARHPWAAEMVVADVANPVILDHRDAVLGVLIGAGFSFPLAGHAVAVLDSYTYGFALQEAASQAADAEADRAPAGGRDAGGRPHLEALAAVYLLKGGYEFAGEFDWGLELVLDGIEQAVARETRARRGQATRT
jgi:AcrR family transcriptional regulator